MSDLEKLMQHGRELGYEGTALQQFVTEQQKEERDARAEERELEKLRLQDADKQREEAEKVREEAEKQREEAEKQREEADKEREEAEKEREEAEKQRQHELQIERLRLTEAEKEREARVGLEREKLKLEAEKEEEKKSSGLAKSKLPPFDEAKDKFDAYINRFESYATLRKWKRAEWAVQLSILLSGRALDTYFGLTDDDQKDYEKVKDALLRRYELTEDEFRKQFFAAKADPGESPSQFMVRLERTLTRWIQSAKIDRSFEGLTTLLTQEQFIRKCHGDLAAFLRERKKTTTDELAKAAELYVDAHGGTIYEPKVVKKKRFQDSASKTDIGSKTAVGKSGNDDVAEVVCKYCKQSGHGVDDCEKLKKRRDRICFVCGDRDHIASACPNRKLSAAVVNSRQEKTLGNGIKQTCVKHDVPVVRGFVNGREVDVMRDKGCTTVVVRESLVKPNQYTGDQYECILADGTAIKCPTAKILVQTSYVNGQVEAAVMKHPVFDLIVGNVERVVNEDENVFPRVASAPPGVESCESIDAVVGMEPPPCVEFCESINGAVNMEPPHGDESCESLYVVGSVTPPVVGSVTPPVVGSVTPPVVGSVTPPVVKSVTLPVWSVTPPGDASLNTCKIESCESYESNVVESNEKCAVAVNNDPESNDRVFQPYVGNVNQLYDTKFSVDGTFIGTIENNSCGIDIEKVVPYIEWSKGDDIAESRVYNKSECDTLGIAAALTRAQAKRTNLSPLLVPQQDVFNAEELSELQKKDASLEVYWEYAKNGVEKETTNATVTFRVKRGILQRVFEPKSGNEKITQILVPISCRKKVLSLAHDGLMSGHMGIKRTLQRVLTNFYWPGVNKDVTYYCRSCDVCQKTTDKGRERPAPLGEMPIISVPFQRVAIDLVGPVVPSRRGHRFILTVIDYASRYPEAVALKKIDVVSVAEALIEVFCRVGFPEEILSDRGSQFMCDVMKEVSRLLSIKQLFSSPYHPICNGLVERFNASLKKILRRMCSEAPKDWDRYLPAVLFAYRTSKQESTGFTPFEIVTGRKVRGPMDILKAFWAKETDNEVKSVYQYVVELKQRLTETCKMAQEGLRTAQAKHKKFYDKKARPKTLKPGTKVLLLLPTKSNKLLMQWQGPYPVVQRKSPVNYVIKIRGREKNFHVNMLKPFVERKVASSAIIVRDGDVPEEELVSVCPVKSGDDWTSVVINPELTPDKKIQLQQLIEEYQEIFTENPGSTDVEMHSIKLTNPEPVRVKPHPIPYALRDTIKQEVATMLEMGIIQESSSPFAATPVIVRKPDGTNRFCINFRALNSQTEFDGEPMPDPEDVYIAMQGSTYMSKMDLSKGYWQIMMSPESVSKTAFVTPDGVYEFLRMPFGLKNSAASFNRLMRKVVGDIPGVGRFIDDIIVYSCSWETQMSTLRKVFNCFKQAGLTIKPAKCQFGFPTMEYVGHVVSEAGLSPREQKISEILSVERPRTKRQVKSFLAMVGYYAKFIPHCSDISEPLTMLVRKNMPNKVNWSDSQEEAFVKLKSQLSSLPVLRIFDKTKPVYVQTDASEIGLGVSMLQEYDGMLHPVKFHSRKLKSSERNYSTLEKECLAIVWAIERLKPYLYGREFILLTDNQPLSVLKKSDSKNARVSRWSIFLQDYSFTVQSIRGVENHIADYLSRA